MSRKRKYDDALAAPEGLQKHWAFHGARLKDKRLYRGQDVFLGDGGPHMDAKKFKNLDKEDEWMRQGYFVSVFAIQRGKAFCGFPVYFKIDHDREYNDDTRSQMRLNAAFAYAKSIIDDGIDMVDPPIFQEYGVIMRPKLILPKRLH